MRNAKDLKCVQNFIINFGPRISSRKPWCLKTSRIIRLVSWMVKVFKCAIFVNHSKHYKNNIITFGIWETCDKIHKIGFPRTNLNIQWLQQTIWSMSSNFILTRYITSRNIVHDKFMNLKPLVVLVSTFNVFTPLKWLTDGESWQYFKTPSQEGSSVSQLWPYIPW